MASLGLSPRRVRLEGPMSDRRPVSPEEATQAGAQRAFVSGVLATGLAAALVAVLTSYFGVQGTLIGAVIGAMGGSALSQMVGVPLDRVERWLVRRGLLTVRRPRIPAARVQAARAAVAGRAPGTARIVRHTLVLGSVGFVLGMAGISGFELAQGRPLSATTTHQAGTGTTVGNLVQSSAAEAPVPTAEPTPGRGGEATLQATSPGATRAVPTGTSARATVGGIGRPSTSTLTVMPQATRAATPAKPADAATAKPSAGTPTPDPRP